MRPDRSLLDFLDVPVLVGDPDGRAVHANPAFVERIARGGRASVGRPVAELFGGGGREAVLRAVARACGRGVTSRFRIREGGVGYAAIASPIVAEGERVGVVLLLKEEVDGGERLLTLVREMERPLERLDEALDTLLEQTGGRRAERHRARLEEGLGAVERLRRSLGEMRELLAGEPVPEVRRVACFDPVRVARRTRERLRARRPDGPAIELLMPAALPAAAADPDRVEELLVELAEARLAADPPPRRLVLGARVSGAPGRRFALLSLCEPPGAAAGAEGAPRFAECAASIGAQLHVALDPILGRGLLLRLPAAERA